MRYIIKINQASIIQYNSQMKTKLDIKDAAIIFLFINLIESKKAIKKGDYYKLNYKVVINEPLLNLKTKQSVVKRYNKLIASKILDPMTESNGGNSLQYFRINNIHGLKYYDKNTDFTNPNYIYYQPALISTSVDTTDKFDNENRQPSFTLPSTSVDTYKSNNNKDNNIKVSSSKENKDKLFFIDGSDLAASIMQYLNDNPSKLKLVQDQSEIKGDISKYVKKFVEVNLSMSDKSKKSITTDPINHASNYLISFLKKERDYNNINSVTYKQEDESSVIISKQANEFYKYAMSKIDRCINVKYGLIKPLSKKEAESLMPKGSLYVSASRRLVKREIQERINKVLDMIVQGEILNGRVIDHIKNELK